MRFWPQNACGSSRSSESWVVAQAKPNLVSSSSRHCPTSEAGVSTSTRSAMPRSAYSLSTMPASMVLPSPTSSASSTRPRNCFSTLRTVSIWCQKRLDAGEMRQAEEFVEALRQAEMGETLAQPRPAAVLLRARAPSRGQQRRQIELDRERDVDVDPRQRRQDHGRRRRPGGHRRAGAIRRTRLGRRLHLRFRRPGRGATAEIRPSRPMMASRISISQRIRARPPGKTWAAMGHSVNRWRSSRARAMTRLLIGTAPAPAEGGGRLSSRIASTGA